MTLIGVAPTELDPWSANCQQMLFRLLMDAFAFPGKIMSPPNRFRFNQLALLKSILATLVDGEVTLADTSSWLSEYDWTRLEVVQKDASSAHFVVCNGMAPPDFEPLIGTLEDPHLGATVIVAVDKIGDGLCFDLSGPGLNGGGQISAGNIDREWLINRNNWCASFPTGVDFILVGPDSFLALPRTTRVELTEEA